MRILLVNPESSLRLELLSALQGPGIQVGDVADLPTAVSILSTSSHPLVVLIDFRLGDWGTSRNLLDFLSEHPAAAMGHVFILLIFTDETIPISFSRAMSQFPVFLAAKPINVRALRSTVSKAALRRTQRIGLLQPSPSSEKKKQP